MTISYSVVKMNKDYNVILCKNTMHNFFIRSAEFLMVFYAVCDKMAYGKTVASGKWPFLRKLCRRALKYREELSWQFIHPKV